ncbi:calmodulin binding domain protein [Oesophagostomum dentatum]|uniref:Calmodulin binding domain protein n=1 Tax=Oesophagostomum dentatum TaxID=61180 RepID=A0A0B1TDK3_OESDE|nr:calmodulin binding domain protein [Oesophagostomum dentatum]
MFFRLYWLCRVMLLHSRLFTDASSRSIAGLNRVNFNARFILKTLMTLCPGKMLMMFTAFLWIISGWILRLCERDYAAMNHRSHLDYVSSIWVVAITFLSVGYGRISNLYANQMGGLGTCASSMVVAVVARKLELTRAEKHVHNFMMDTQLTKQLKHSAANVLRETWLIYKFRKKVEKVDYARIRQHQRKFLVAIYEYTSSNTYDLIQDVHSTQEGLSLRITAIEHQLSDISREIASLAEMMRSRKRSLTSEETSPSHHVRRRREAIQQF